MATNDASQAPKGTDKSPESGTGTGPVRVVTELMEDWAENQGNVWSMLTSLMILSFVAAMVGIAYGYQFSAKGALLAFLASLLGYSIGGISGFLFGFPRYSDSAVVQSVEDLKAALAQPSTQTGEAKSSIRHSTNLERITDWLMTMIVGATVVNLKDLTNWANEQFLALSSAIVNSGVIALGTDPQETSAAPGALLVLPFMVAGFLHLYLWARRYLPLEWRKADDDLSRKRFREIIVRQKEQEQSLQELKTKLHKVDPNLLKPFQEFAKSMNVDAAIIEDVITRYRGASDWIDDPMKGFGTATADNFRLSATVVATGDEQYPFNANIEIERTDQTEFAAAIVLFFHNSFDDPVQIDGYYSGNKYADTIWCSEGFTLGALVIDAPSGKTTRLALDLDSLPNLPKGFKSTERSE